MELFQELVFTISFSLIVSLLIAKLFSMASSCDDETSAKSQRFEEKFEKEWVVCDSETEGKGGYFEDAVKVSEKVASGDFEAEFGSGCVIDAPKSVGVVGAGQVFDESPERTDFKDSAVSLVRSDESNGGSLIKNDCAKIEHGLSAPDDGDDVKVEEVDEVFDDDWEGVERTELEKIFGAAVALVGSKRSLFVIDNEVKMQLYGLHKVATEGPCFAPPPMALKVSARANWNAWKRLENLGPEDAMEQYIALLSRNAPDWMGSHASEDNMQDFLVTGTSGKLPVHVETQPGAENERVLEQLNSMAAEDPNIIIRDKQ